MRILKPLAVLISMLFAAFIAEASVPFDTNFVGKTVVFLYGAKPDKTVDGSAPLGTGFLVRVPDSSRLGFTIILVTARHIVDPEWVHCPNTVNPEVIFARINGIDPLGVEKVRYIRLSLLNHGRPTWFKHTRDDIDAAALLFPASDEDLRKRDFRTLPAYRLPTDEELSKLSIGDDIVSAGMLFELKGAQRNYPVFKFGKISNIPGEDIQTSCGGAPIEIRAWLIAANLVPGNSGSPILYYPPFGENGDISSPGLQRLVLIGVQLSSAVSSAATREWNCSALFFSDIETPDDVSGKRAPRSVSARLPHSGGITRLVSTTKGMAEREGFKSGQNAAVMHTKALSV